MGTCTTAPKSTFTLNNLNQITGYMQGTESVLVDYDDNGNTIQIGNQLMAYDDADRLTSVVQVNPATQQNVIKTEYVYDGLSRRSIARTYSWDVGNSSWIQQNERRFIYDGMDLIQERDGSNNVIASYVRDGNIGGALSRTTSSGTYYYHYDGNGNVVAMTNSSGATGAEYTYDAYGNLTAMSGSEATDNPIRFSTKYFDGNTGYYDFGFRSYDPVTGRWLNRDPIGEEGGLNLYGFVGNSPGNLFDEYGLDPVIVNIYGSDQKPNVSFWKPIFNLMKYPGTTLYKPTKKQAINALLHADGFYFWGHGATAKGAGAIMINERESLDLSTINWIARTRKEWGKNKMDFVVLDGCNTAHTAEAVNSWLGLAKTFQGVPDVTWNPGRGPFGYGRRFKTSAPITYDPTDGAKNKYKKR